MKKFVFVIISNSKREITTWANIAYLVSALKGIDNLSVKVMRFTVDDIRKIASDVLKSEPDFVGLSVFQDNLNTCIEFAKEVKKRNDSIKTIFGNIEATHYAEYIMKHYQDVDIIVKGEAEKTLRDLLLALISNIELSSCKGILFRSNGTYYLNPKREVEEDIDIFGIPDRSFMKDYKTNEYSVIGSRGCSGSCTFCDVNTINYRRNHIRIRSVTSIIEEMTQLANDYGCIHINFIDPIFLGGNLETLFEFANELEKIKLDVTFRFNLTCDSINDDMVEVLKKLKQLGLELIFLGFEAANSADLKLFSKKASLHDNKRAIKLFAEHDIPYQYGLINFNPYTTLESLKINLEFIAEHEMIVDLSILTQKLCLYGGAPILKLIIKDGLTNVRLNEPIEDVMDYNFMNPVIHNVYNAFKKAQLNMGIDYIILHDLLLYNRFERYISSDGDLKNRISDLEREISKHSVYIAKRIIEGASCSSDDMYDLVNEYVKDAAHSIKEKRKKLIRDISIMAYKLHKNNQLVFHTG